jgi:DNA repair protein RadC
LKHIPSGIEIKCSKERSQGKNRFFARRLLVEKLENQVLGIISSKRKEIKKIHQQKKKRSKRAKEKKFTIKKENFYKKRDEEKSNLLKNTSNIKLHYEGHRKRLKDKFFSNGLYNLADYEVLELVLTYVVLRKDVKILAKELIFNFGSLKQVFDASLKDLIKVKGVSENIATFIVFLKKFASFYCFLDIKKKSVLDSPEKVYSYLMSSIGTEQVEKFYILNLNSKNEILSCLELESGTVNKTYLNTRKIAELALKHNAVSVIIAHNHPSGILVPSKNDVHSTYSIKKALEIIDVFLLDHIIVANNKYFSFKEHNLLCKR